MGILPLDWQDPQARSTTRRTDDFPVSVIQREVIAEEATRPRDLRRHAPIRKRTPFLPADRSGTGADGGCGRPQLQQGSIVAQLDRLEVRVFVVSTSTDFDISTIQANVVTWARPSLALVRGTPLGLASSVAYFAQALPVIRARGGIQETLRPDVAAAPPMQDVVDAMLYLGPPSTITHSRLSPELCADPVYLKMRLERLTEFASPGFDPAATFRAECAAVMKR